MSEPAADTDGLERIGRGIPALDPALRNEVALRLAEQRPAAGRLVDVAAWWAGVRADPHAAAPGVVTHLAWGVSGFRPRLDPPLRVTPNRPVLGAPAHVQDAIATAVTAVDAAVDGGSDLVLVSADDDAAARVMAACLMGQDAVEAAGWPHESGLDDDAWVQLVTGLRDGLRDVRGLRGKPEPLLHALGSPTLAAGTTALLQAAARRTPVLLDGYGSFVSAVLAHRVARPARDWWLVPHGSELARVQRALTSLAASPLVSLGIEAEDGSAALLGLGLLEAACGLLPP